MYLSPQQRVLHQRRLECHRTYKVPLYVFDLDGTLFNCDHRTHILSGSSEDKWREFYEAGRKDAPIEPIFKLMRSLLTSGAEVRFWSGRADFTKAFTIDMLAKYGEIDKSYLEFPGVMELRQYDPVDKRNDDVMKLEIFNNLDPKDRDRLVCVFEDRQRVVDMWRANGITCLQVAPGDF